MTQVFLLCHKTHAFSDYHQKHWTLDNSSKPSLTSLNCYLLTTVLNVTLCGILWVFTCSTNYAFHCQVSKLFSHSVFSPFSVMQVFGHQCFIFSIYSSVQSSVFSSFPVIQVLCAVTRLCSHQCFLQVPQHQCFNTVK